MHKSRVSSRGSSVSPVFAGLLIFCGVALSDPIDDAEDLPATLEQTRFIHAVISGANEAAPDVEGWHREISVTASGNKVQDGKTPLIYARATDFPLKIAVQVNYREITDADRKEAATQKTAEQLQQEMLAAGMRGDTTKLEELQRELAAVMQASMEAGAMGQAVGATPTLPRENPKRFYVQVIVNGEGESIGKRYDFEAPDVAKAFRVDKSNADTLTYKYYLGAWEISDLDDRNWRIVDPADAQTSANHLRAVVASVSVYGDRQSVEDFVGNHLHLPAVNQMVN